MEDSVVDEMIILSRVFRKWEEGHGLDLFGSGKGRALVNAVMNLGVR